MRHVVFLLEEKRFSLPLSTVKEVFPMPSSVSRVPRGPKVVEGIVNLRGKVVTLINLQMLLGLKDKRLTSHTVLLLDRTRGAVGLMVNQVEGIQEVTEPERPIHSLNAEDIEQAVAEAFNQLA